MENLKIVLFEVESEAYQATIEIKNNLSTENYILSQMVLVKNENGKIVLKDSFDTGTETINNTAIGGLIGGLLGIINGPLGIIFGGSLGSLIGSIADLNDNNENVSIIEKVCKSIPEGRTAIIALAQESIPLSFDKNILRYNTTIITLDAGEISAEIEKDNEIQKQLEQEVKEKLKEEKTENKKQEIEKHKEQLLTHFENIKIQIQKKSEIQDK